MKPKLSLFIVRRAGTGTVFGYEALTDPYPRM